MMRDDGHSEMIVKHTEDDQESRERNRSETVAIEIKKKKKINKETERKFKEVENEYAKSKVKKMSTQLYPDLHMMNLPIIPSMHHVKHLYQSALPYTLNHQHHPRYPNYHILHPHWQISPNVQTQKSIFSPPITQRLYPHM